ncbi:MAG: hypothetical protein K8I82_06605 [Anaerolineae bacterium]|nr:hypothetical protein [Anaerolineae bacterium]
MSQLKLIYQLLREEYSVSRHIFWLDEASGRFVNDITQTLYLIVNTAHCLREGDENCWRELVAHCIERSMSAVLMQAIGAYLQNCTELEPLPTINLTELKYRNRRSNNVPLLDETDHLLNHSPTVKPEPDRKLHLKGEHQWSQYPIRLKDEHPIPQTQTVNKSQHWLF